MPDQRRSLMVLTLFLQCLFLMACARNAFANQSLPLRQITLQLKWTHQFQFAGFYAAQEQGFYKEAGLDVTFKERHPGVTVVDEVLSGRAEFGISNHELLLDYNDKKPVVALGAIFQHSPNVILSRADSQIFSPKDLQGKRVMLLGTTASSLWAMLASQGVTKNDLKLQQLSWSTQDLIERKTDAMAAYLTSQPYSLKERGIPVNIMRPINYGIDFYGDTLFTSRSLTRDAPDMVEKFATASFKGWGYAMAHPAKIVDLIIAKYHPKQTREELLYEAEAMKELILPRLVVIGSMTRQRWDHIANVYRTLGLLDTMRPLDDFIFVPEDNRRLQKIARLTPLFTIGACVIALIAIFLLLFNWHLKKSIASRTRELERNRKSLRQVIDLVPNMIYAKNREGIFLLVNRTMAESLGSSVSKLIGTKHEEIHPDTVQMDEMQRNELSVLDTGLPRVCMEEPYQHADNTTHWLQTTRLPFTTADTEEPAVLILSVDISKRRESEAALKSSEARFRAIFNQTFQFSGILNLDGTLTEINETALRAMGTVEQAVIGQPFWETVWWNHDPKAAEWLKNSISKSAAGRTIRSEILLPLPTGEIQTLDFSLKPVLNEKNDALFLITEGRDISALKKTEDELRQLNEDLEKRVAERTLSLEKTTRELEQSVLTLKTAQEDLIMSEKQAALGRLVAGVAHEINTPIGIGVTASSFLEERIQTVSHSFEAGELKKSDLEKFVIDALESSSTIMSNLSRAAELIKSFKQVAADQSSEMPRSFNLRSYVDEVLLSLRPRYKRTKHTIKNNCQDVELYSYPGAFMQIITNLLVNSLSHAFTDDEAGTMIIDGYFEGNTLAFSFSDDGSGIPPEIMDKVFEPFYTTKRGKGGTGLGLHIVFNTVTNTLRGTIRIDTKHTPGTRYIITLPVNQVQES